MAAKKEIIVPTKTNTVSKKDLLKQAMMGINKRFGEGAVDTLANKKDEMKTEFIKTKSIEVNTVLSGGLGKGRMSEIYGIYDSGKTSLLLETIGYNMQINPDFQAGWFETEGSISIDHAINTFGIDPDRFTVWQIQDFGAEKGLDVLEALIRSAAFDIVVVNTIAGLTPKSEMDSDMEQQSIAVMARMLSKLMRKITGIVAKTKNHVSFINQVRANVGSYGGGDISVGGKSVPYYSSQRLQLRNGFLEAEDKAKGYDPEKFKKIDVSVKKNRCCTTENPYKKTTYYVEYGIGTDQVGCLPDLAVSAGIIYKGGAWFKDLDAKGNPKVVNGFERRWQGVGNFRTYIRDNPDFADELRQRIENAGITIEDTLTTAMNEAEIEEATSEERAASNLIEEIDD